MSADGTIPSRGREGRARALFFAALLLLYGACFLYLTRTPLYTLAQAHNDRFFSADDVYYVEKFFSTGLDQSMRVIKHPLLIVFGWAFTNAEQLLFAGGLGVKHHYELIVLCQLCASALSCFYLDKLLEERYALRQGAALALCAVYALAFSTVFYTFIAESYIFSSLLLLMTFYYAGRGDTGATVALGVLAAGVTITNAALWAVIVALTPSKPLRTRALTLLLGGVCFCAAVAVFPIRGRFFGSLLSGALSSARNYSDRFGPLELIKRVFFVFFGSTAFYIDTQDCSPFGEFAGDALSFVPSAPPLVTLLALGWLALLVWSAVRNRRDPLLYAPLGVLAANLLLHGAIQYGLKEGFLYSLHHFSAQLLLLAPLLRDGALKKPARRAVLGFLALYLACELARGLCGGAQMLASLKGGLT